MLNISFIGVDRSILIPDLKKIQEEFPLVNIEWGFLVSQDKQDKRYPSPSWVEDVLLEHSRTMNIAVHLCGKSMRNFLDWYPERKNYITQPQEVRLVKLAARTQLNFSWEYLTETQQKAALDLAKDDFELVVQYNKSNRNYWQQLTPHLSAVTPLVDASGGRGKVISNFAYPPGYMYVGFAGGITPENCAQVKKDCEQVCQGQTRFWLDMESGVREDDYFSLDKVRAVLRALL